MEKMTSCIYKGNVIHQRLRPRRHRLKYSVFSILVNLDELDDLSKKTRLFAYNRTSVFSVFDKDHGDSTRIRKWVEKVLEQESITNSHNQIMMLCYPRIFGYVFNPITTYFCYGANNKLGAIIYEVHNTYKERHWYVLPVDYASNRIIKQSCKKKFYVSPFVQMDCTYQFRVQMPSEKVRVIIREEDQDGLLLAAAFYGHRRSFNDSELIKAIFLYPLMTIKVIAGIHIEALFLFLKRVPFFSHKPKNIGLDSSDQLAK